MHAPVHETGKHSQLTHEFLKAKGLLAGCTSGSSASSSTSGNGQSFTSTGRGGAMSMSSSSGEASGIYCKVSTCLDTLEPITFIVPGFSYADGQCRKTAVASA